jgi:hypothetical protein
VLCIVFLPVTHRVFQRDTFVRQAVGQLRPGMDEAEVRALLKPFRADLPVTLNGVAGDAYFFHGVDEFVEVIMDGTGDDARVLQVNRIPDDGPWWDRSRRNWEWRLR